MAPDPQAFPKDRVFREGTREVGSRWVPPGFCLVHASRALSLCVLESLVHMDLRHMRDNFVAIAIDIPPDLDVEIVAGEAHLELPAGQRPFRPFPAKLPRRWRDVAARPRLQEIGAGWLQSARICLLHVPSVVVSEEANFLINPLHADFQRLRIGKSEPFVFDPHLVP